MPDMILLTAEEKMEKTLEVLDYELAQVRTGRANPQMLERVQAEYYGEPTPINQIAAISVSEGRTLVIKPFDKSSLKDIEKAINNADLGINPQNNGEVIRLVVPQLTEQLRKDLAKKVGKIGEECKVKIRNIRRDANDAIKKADGVTEDDIKAYQEEVQKLTDQFVKKIDQVCDAKEADILSV